MTLDEHLKKFAEGDTAGFDEFYLATKRLVYHIALSVLRDRTGAEDAMQACYLKVLAGASGYRAGTNAQAWVARIARNEALNQKKRRDRELAVDITESEPLYGTAQPDEYGLLTDVARRVLPEEEFAVLMLAAADGYKRREIAVMLGIPVATVTWRYHRALKMMRHALEGGKA